MKEREKSTYRVGKKQTENISQKRIYKKKAIKQKCKENTNREIEEYKRDNSNKNKKRNSEQKRK